MALEGVQRRVQAVAGCTFVAILLGQCHLEAVRDAVLGRVPLGGCQMSWNVMESVGVWAGPGFLGGLSGAGVLGGEDEQTLSAVSSGRQLSPRPSSCCTSGKL